MSTILIVEDDKEISNLVKIALKDGYNVEALSSGNEAIYFIASHIVDLVILDLGLPDIDGQEVINKIRSFNTKIPILVLSARSADKEKVKAFEDGADDYVTKPFSVIELKARIKYLLNRFSYHEIIEEQIFVNGYLKIDYLNHLVFVDDNEIKLSNYEYKLLELLSKNLGKTLTHSYILHTIWGLGYDDTGSLRVFVSSLRRKIEKKDNEIKLIRNDSGIGYRMNKI